MSSHRVLLTGANGFLGSHILKQLLDHPGVSVRAVVRSASKVEAVKNDFGAYGNLDFAVVPDITAPNAFHEALSSSDVPFDLVIHSASPFLYKAATNNRDFLDPAVNGTTEILKSVKAIAPAVKRVVVTSSFASVADFPHPDKMAGKTFVDDDWNPITWDEALKATDKNIPYQGSKTFAEQAAWKFLEEEKPGFDIATICPPMIYGPLQHTVKKTSDLNESTARIYNLFINSKKDGPLPPDAVYFYVDPTEVAFAHVAALFTPEASNQRFIVSAGEIASQTISDILRASFPELDDRTPIGKPGVSSLPEKASRYSINNEKSRKVLGIKYRSVEDTLKDLGTQLLALAKTNK